MISVIVPVYNVEKYLDQCLSSILNQTYKKYELIIVNDGSPDNSQTIIDKFQKKYPKLIKSYLKENGGLSSARNYGITKAKGEYICFIDSDDWVEPNYLEELYNKAVKDDLDIVVCDTIMDYPNHRNILKSNLGYSDDIVRNYIISYPMAVVRLFKKSLFTKDYLFTDKILYEDLCLCPTFANRTNKIGFIDKALYHYIQRESSIMHQKNFSPKLYDITKVLDNVYNSFKKNNNLEKYYEEIEYLYITHLLRSTTLRFLEYKEGKSKLKVVNEIMDDRFPNWNKNKYLKKSSFKLKLICRLSYHKRYLLIKLLMKVGNK